MIDTFGRSITYLRVSVTDLCNLRCRYCMPEDGVCKKEHADMLTEDELIQAVEAAAALGITKLRITGGEPLVKKNIVSICRRASRVPGIREVCLTTNGILLPELARPLKEAGVSRLNLSLDTLDPQKYAHITRSGSLDDFWKGEIRPADVHLAFELINARYISKKPTILSSENTLEAILRGDEAIGSRLFEMAGGYYMDCSRARNWRTARRQT